MFFNCSKLVLVIKKFKKKNKYLFMKSTQGHMYAKLNKYVCDVWYELKYMSYELMILP